jgi:hypothetical protein
MASQAVAHDSEHHAPPPNVDADVVLRELVATTHSASGRFKAWVWGLGILSVAGIVALVLKVGLRSGNGFVPTLCSWWRTDGGHGSCNGESQLGSTNNTYRFFVLVRRCSDSYNAYPVGGYIASTSN